MTLRMAVVDDESAIRKLYKNYLEEWGKEQKEKVYIKTFSSAESFLFEYEEDKHFDIILLDIEMGEMSGVELAKTLREKNKNLQIIFISGYGEYIGSGYDVDALHFLIKPISKDKLFDVLHKARIRANRAEKFIMIRTEDENVRLYLKDILSLSADRNYIDVSAGNAKYRTRATLTEMEELLDQRFFRISRSDIINMDYIERMDKEKVTLEGGTLFYLPRGKFSELNKKIIEYY